MIFAGSIKFFEHPAIFLVFMVVLFNYSRFPPKKNCTGAFQLTILIGTRILHHVGLS